MAGGVALEQGRDPWPGVAGQGEGRGAAAGAQDAPPENSQQNSVRPKKKLF